MRCSKCGKTQVAKGKLMCKPCKKADNVNQRQAAEDLKEFKACHNKVEHYGKILVGYNN